MRLAEAGRRRGRATALAVPGAAGGVVPNANGLVVFGLGLVKLGVCPKLNPPEFPNAGSEVPEADASDGEEKLNFAAVGREDEVPNWNGVEPTVPLVVVEVTVDVIAPAPKPWKATFDEGVVLKERAGVGF